MAILQTSELARRGQSNCVQTEHYIELDIGVIVADMERLEKRIAKKEDKKPF